MANLHGGSSLDLRQPEHDPHFRKPLGVAAIEITDLFTFKQGKPIPDGENEKILPFMLMGNENEPCEDVFRRLVFDEKTPTEARDRIQLNIFCSSIVLRFHYDSKTFLNY